MNFYRASIEAALRVVILEFAEGTAVGLPADAGHHRHGSFCFAGSGAHQRGSLVTAAGYKT